MARPMQCDAFSKDADVARTALRAGALLLAGFVAFVAPARAEQQPAAEPVSVIERINGTLNAQTSLVRSMVNECVVAGVSSVVVAMSISGPAGPVATAALGAMPGMSTYGIGAMGCAAGAVGGAVSAAMIHAWEDRTAVAEAITTPIVAAWTAIEEADEWSIASMISSGGEAVYAALGGTASTLMAWFQPTPDAVPDTIMLASNQTDEPQSRDLIRVSYQPRLGTQLPLASARPFAIQTPN